MIKAALRLTCVCLSCSVLAACGGSSPSNRQQIADMFNGMYTAFANGDYARVCGYMSYREDGNIVSGARKAGMNVSSCTDAFNTILKDAGVTKAQIAKAFGASGIQHKLDAISVHGNQATVTFTETEKGKTAVETDAVVREGGQWRADRIIKQTQSG
jgi:hypothetical protein